MGKKEKDKNMLNYVKALNYKKYKQMVKCDKKCITNFKNVKKFKYFQNVNNVKDKIIFLNYVKNVKEKCLE